MYEKNGKKLKIRKKNRFYYPYDQYTVVNIGKIIIIKKRRK